MVPQPPVQGGGPQRLWGIIGAAVPLRPRRDALLALLVYLALAAALVGPAWRHPQTATIGLLGDPQQTEWALRWTPYALVHHLNPLVTDYGNTPDGVNLMWNTSMPLLGLLLAPVTLTLGPVVAYDLLVTLGFALSALAAFLAVRRLLVRHVRIPQGGRPGALGGPLVGPLAGGLLYGFSPYMTSEAAGHANLVVAVTPPFLVILLDELLTGRRRSPRLLGVLLGLLATAQLLVNEEILATEALVAGLGVALLALTHRGLVAARARRVATGLGVGLAVFAALGAWPLVEQFGGPQRVSGPVQPPGDFVMDLLGFVVPTGDIAAAPHQATDLASRFTGNTSEIGGYLGVPLLLLLGATAARLWRREPVRVAVVSGAAVALLAMGPRLHVGGHETPLRLPWAALDRLPLLDDVVPSRLMVYVFLFAAVVLAAGIDELWWVGARLRPRPLRLAGWVLVGVGLLSLAPRTLAATTVDVPGFFGHGGLDTVPEGAVVLFAPYPGRYSVPPMLWDAQAGIRVRMRGGYFRRPLPGDPNSIDYDHSQTATLMVALQTGAIDHVDVTASVRDAVRREWRAWRVDAVVVGPEDFRDRMVAFLGAVVGSPPQQRDGVEIWTGLENSLQGG